MMGRRRRAEDSDWFKYQFWALRVRPAGHGTGAPDLPRLPADAARCELQSDAVKAEMQKKMAEAEAASSGPSS